MATVWRAVVGGDVQRPLPPEKGEAGVRIGHRLCLLLCLFPLLVDVGQAGFWPFGG